MTWKNSVARHDSTRFYSKCASLVYDTTDVVGMQHTLSNTCQVKLRLIACHADVSAGLYLTNESDSLRSAVDLQNY